MNKCRAFLAFIGLSLFLQAQAHTYFSALTIDGVSLKEGDCVRPHPGSKYDYPIAALDRQNGLQSGDMTCGWLPNAAKAANRKCPVNPGSKVTIQWHYEMGLGDSDTFIVDPSHKGPCIVYMAKSDTGAGNVWFKIFEDGYDTATKKFCVDKLKTNKGKLDITIPTDITPGNYLLRGELIALHEGEQLYGAQPYVGCAELTVGGSGTVNPGNLVAFPGAYTPNSPGILFNIYSGKITNYPIPGPALYKSGSTPPAAPVTTKAVAPVTTKAVSPVTTKKPSSTSTTTTTTTTTGKASSTSTTTGKSSSTSTTTGQPSSTSTTTGKIEAMCYKPGTPYLQGRINKNPPKCGKNERRSRCEVGQCCSKYGYCGPFQERDGRYYEYLDGKLQEVTAQVATSLYCNNATADYRLYPCSSFGLTKSNIDDADVSSEDKFLLSAAQTLSHNTFIPFFYAVLVTLVALALF